MGGTPGSSANSGASQSESEEAEEGNPQQAQVTSRELREHNAAIPGDLVRAAVLFGQLQGQRSSHGDTTVDPEATTASMPPPGVKNEPPSDDDSESDEDSRTHVDAQPEGPPTEPIDSDGEYGGLEGMAEEERQVLSARLVQLTQMKMEKEFDLIKAKYSERQEGLGTFIKLTRSICWISA